MVYTILFIHCLLLKWNISFWKRMQSTRWIYKIYSNPTCSNIYFRSFFLYDWSIFLIMYLILGWGRLEHSLSTKDVVLHSPTQFPKRHTEWQGKKGIVDWLKQKKKIHFMLNEKLEMIFNRLSIENLHNDLFLSNNDNEWVLTSKIHLKSYHGMTPTIDFPGQGN